MLNIVFFHLGISKGPRVAGGGTITLDEVNSMTKERFTEVFGHVVQDIPWDWSVAVMHYPVWTWRAPAEALPARTPDGFRIDIAPWLSRKKMAVAAHRSQHGGVIEDATEAFELEPGFVAQLLTTTETLTWPA